MARIVLGSYFFRYPLGGMMSYVLQYLLGLRRLGHDVWFVEKADYENACFDVARGVMTDDPTYGIRVGGDLLDRFGFRGRWVFVDRLGTTRGTPDIAAEDLLDTADVLLDMGTHGALLADVGESTLRVLLDGEPGFSQIKRIASSGRGDPIPVYDEYVTNGLNVGAPDNAVPTVGLEWRHLPHPVDTLTFRPRDGAGTTWTTVMNWQSHGRIEWRGRILGQKDIEFERFIDLPGRVAPDLEVAVAGDVPRERLQGRGWRLARAHDVTAGFDEFWTYIAGSAGEFSVCKNVFVDLWSGWFSDRSAAYLAAGRPVVLQDTGFSAHLPTGEGLFAVSTVEEAADAIGRVHAEPQRHAAAARRIAEEHLDAPRLLGDFLSRLGV